MSTFDSTKLPLTDKGALPAQALNEAEDEEDDQAQAA